MNPTPGFSPAKSIRARAAAAGRTATPRRRPGRVASWLAAGLALAPAPATTADPRGDLLAYVGTYSSPPVDTPPGKVDLPPGNGRGIHVFRVDRTTGALTPAGVVEHPTSPSYLAFNAAGTRAYSTNATDKVDGGTAGTVTAFAVDRANGRLTALNTVSSGGLGPTHLSLHPSGHYVLVANYAGGSVAALPVLPDGRLGPAASVRKTTGVVGPKRATSAPPGSFAISGHDFPHAHMIQPDPAGRFVISADLGLDRLHVWRFDLRSGALAPHDPPEVALPPGDGPRHFAFHPNGRWLFSLQEEGSTLVRFDYDAAAGRLTTRQTISSLPQGYAGSSFASGILVSRDGRFVYAANRLLNSIAWFRIADDGTLAWAGEEWTRGDYPRSFNFDPTGRFLYACNQRSDNLAVFRVDAASGRLTFTGEWEPVGNPSAIAFLDLGP